MFKVPNTDNSGNTWRNITVGAMFIAFIFLGGTKLSPQFFSQTFSEKIFSSLEAVGNLSAATPAEAPVAVTPQPKPILPELIGEKPDPEKFTAKSMVVKDHKTGALLYGKNEYEPRSIASITKLLSALVLLERHPDWATSTQVVADDVLDTHMYAKDTYKLSELWQAALVGSSNKAILSLADASGWSREAFVERMNQKATELGMSGANFVEPTGLEDANVATASDVSLLLSSALAQADIQKTVLGKELNLFSKERQKNHHMWSTNWLLLGWIPNNFAEINGGKTGFITASGYNFAVEVTDKSGHTLDVVVLGAASHEQRFTEARDIAEWAFANYRWPE